MMHWKVAWKKCRLIVCNVDKAAMQLYLKKAPTQL